MRNEYAVPVDDAIARLDVIEDYDPGDGPKPCVHTFAQSAVAMLGAHWAVDEAREMFERCGVEEAGETASAMGHGLVCVDREDNRTIFFATKAVSS